MLSTLLILVSSVFARSSGSPVCYADTASITKGMGSQSNLGYFATVSEESSGVYTITIDNNKNTKTFNGLLMYAASATDPFVHYGKFVSFDSKKYKYMSNCAGQGVKGADESTITHSNKNSVGFDSKFKLVVEGTVPSDLVLVSVVSNGKAWQQLGSVSLK